MRFLHTSDLHLGISLCERSFIEYQQKLVDLLCDAVEKYSVDTVIIAGDIYDNALSNADAISIYNKLVTNLCLKQNKKVVICAGNHDGAARLSSCNELLRECGLHIYGRIAFPVEPLEFEGCNVYVLPYFNIDEIKNAFPNAEIKGYADAMKAVLDNIRNSLDVCKVNILVAHCFVTGGELSDSDTAARIGGSSAIPASVFDKFDYVALGHLHKPQTIAGKIRYSGTPLKYSFSEATHKKSFTIFDSDTKEFKEAPIPQPIELRTIENTFENLLEIGKSDKSRDDFMKITMTNRFAGQDTYSQLKELYPNMLLLQGKQIEADGASNLTLEDITSLSPIELVKRFYSEQTGEEISDEQLDWFNPAAEEVESGGNAE